MSNTQQLKNNSNNCNVILVIGGTGQTGSCAVKRLLDLNLKNTLIRILSRSANRMSFKNKDGSYATSIDVIQGDVSDAKIVSRAMIGVTNVLYLVGPKPNLMYLLKSKTVARAYVTGLENVLQCGRKNSTLKQVILLSAEHCDQPWLPPTIIINTLAGFSQLMHVKQERLLREEAKIRSDFSYLVVRPPLLGPANTEPEKVILQSIDLCSKSMRGAFRSVTRSAVVEVMLSALLIDTNKVPQAKTITLFKDGKQPLKNDYNYQSNLASIANDKEALPSPIDDRFYYIAQKLFLLGVGLIAAIIMAGTILAI